MKKFEDIPKKDFLQAPDGYFEGLPTKISARIQETSLRETRSSFRVVLQYALPVVVLVALGITWFSQKEKNSAENLLTTVESEALINYLADADEISYEAFLEEMDLNTEEATALENAVYQLQWQDQNIDDLLEEMENQNL